MLSYILADNEHCKQVLLAQEPQPSQDVNGAQSQTGLMLFIVNGISAIGTRVADVSNGRARDKVYWQDVLCIIKAKNTQL